MDNYEITKRKMMATFPSQDHDAIIKKLGLEHDEEYIYLSLFSHDFKISRESGDITERASGTPAGFNEAMTILDYLCYSKPGAIASGEFTVLQNLSSVLNANSYAGEGMFGSHEKFWDEKSELLDRKCQELGGIPWGKGDISYRLPFLKGIDMVFSFWESDDEFPAQIQLMFDLNTLDFIHYETVWYAAGVIFRYLESGI